MKKKEDGMLSAFAPIAAGVLSYPDKRAIPFSYRAEFLEVGGGKFAANGITKATASITILASDPVFLHRIFIAQYRTDGSPPLGIYLPPSGFVPDGNGSMFKGLNFIWGMQSNRAGNFWQDGERDSLMLNPDSSYKLPEDCELRKDEVITAEATPLVAADSGDSYRMFLILDGYKMVD